MRYIWVFAGLLSLAVTGCIAEWTIPEGYYVECEGDADCPDTSSCMLRDVGPARVCVTEGRAECGNGVEEAGAQATVIADAVAVVAEFALI